MRLTLKRTLGILALVPLLIMTTTSVQATVISFTVPAPTTSVSAPSNLSSSTASALSMFDPGQGILNSATFTLTGSLNSAVSCSYSNLALFGSATAGCKTDLSLSFVAPGSFTPTINIIRSASCTAYAFNPLSADPTDCTATDDFSAAVSLFTVTTGAANLSLLTGTGNYTVYVKLNFPAGIELTGSGLNLSTSSAASGGESLSLEVVYDYTPVPEPTTVLLLSLGLLGIVGGKSRGQRLQYS